MTLLAAGFGFSLLVAVICDLKRLRKNRPPMPPGAKKPNIVVTIQPGRQSCPRGGSLGRAVSGGTNRCR